MKKALMQKYFKDHYTEHLDMIQRNATAEGRMALAYEKSDGTHADAFFRFFKDELDASQSGKCLIYMPDFGLNRRRNRKGKIIIEVDARVSSFELGEDCFEFQISRETNLRAVKLQNLYYKWRKYPTSEFTARYYNMFLSWDDAIPLVQRILFSSFFRQRCLMTTQSRVLGSITTQRFVSEEMGQLLSIRSCLLNEYK